MEYAPDTGTARFAPKADVPNFEPEEGPDVEAKAVGAELDLKAGVGAVPDPKAEAAGLDADPKADVPKADPPDGLCPNAEDPNEPGAAGPTAFEPVTGGPTAFEPVNGGPTAFEPVAGVPNPPKVDLPPNADGFPPNAPPPACRNPDPEPDPPDPVAASTAASLKSGGRGPPTSVPGGYRALCRVSASCLV